MTLFTTLNVTQLTQCKPLNANVSVENRYFSLPKAGWIFDAVFKLHRHPGELFPTIKTEISSPSVNKSVNVGDPAQYNLFPSQAESESIHGAQRLAPNAAVRDCQQFLYSWLKRVKAWTLPSDFRSWVLSLLCLVILLL